MEALLGDQPKPRFSIQIFRISKRQRQKKRLKKAAS